MRFQSKYGIWFNNIKEEMAHAAVAVCLISADYLLSDFCIKEEIPYLLRRREKEGMVIIPVLINSCLWEVFDRLKNTQMFPREELTWFGNPDHVKGSPGIKAQDLPTLYKKENAACAGWT